MTFKKMKLTTRQNLLLPKLHAESHVFEPFQGWWIAFTDIWNGKHKSGDENKIHIHKITLENRAFHVLEEYL